MHIVTFFSGQRSGKRAKLKSPSSSNKYIIAMLLIIPVRTLLLYFGFGLCSYSMFTFLLTATPLELQFMGILLNIVSVGLGLYIASRQVSDMEHTVAEITGGCRVCRCCEGSVENDTDEDVEVTKDEEDNTSEEEADIYVETNRRVEEKDGRLIVTTTYEPVSETEEVREMVEKTPTEPSPTEETAEFADLLQTEAEKKVN